MKLYHYFLLLPFLSFPSGVFAGADGTYLESLNPVRYLEFNVAPANRVTLPRSIQLVKSASFLDDFPAQVAGPHSFVSQAWDFSTCEGGFAMIGDSALAQVGHLPDTEGLSYSYWVKGEYNGSTPRIMAGSIDTGARRDTIWAGTNNYVNIASDGVQIWNGQWHHIACTVDFTQFEDNVKIFVDGKLRGVRSHLYRESLTGGQVRHWMIGSRNANDVGFGYGALAGIAVFDRTLSEYEVNYIKSGPVFAGLDQSINVTGRLTLDGVVPNGAPVTWSKVSGPNGANIRNPLALKTTVTFNHEGVYVFRLTSGSATSEVTITVLPNEAPLIVMENGKVLPLTSNSIQLNPQVSDDYTDSNRLLYSWSVIKRPSGSNVQFSNESIRNPTVFFDLEGIYHLQLASFDGAETSYSVMSVFVTNQERPSYLEFLDPIAIYSMDKPASTDQLAKKEKLGKAAYVVTFPKSGVPLLEQGARPYTGNAWDFSGTDSALRLLVNKEMEKLYTKASAESSLSFWIKTNEETTAGHITDIMGLQRLHNNQRYHFGNYSNQFSPIQGSFSSNTWHQVVHTSKYENNQFTRKLYLNGVLVGQAIDQEPSRYWEEKRGNTASHIGSRGRAGVADSFEGLLDDFALFNYELNPSEVLYIYNGPSDSDKNLLDSLDSITVDAGSNQYINTSSDYQVTLSGSVSNAGGLTPEWSFYEGSIYEQSGTVTFANANNLNTTATFSPKQTDKDGLYNKFKLRLHLKDRSGKIVKSDEVLIVFYHQDAPEPRPLQPLPAEGEHPRLFFTEADLPLLRSRVAQSEIAQRGLQVLKKRLSAFSDPAKDTHYYYQELLAERPIPAVLLHGGKLASEPQFFDKLAEAALVAWIGENNTTDQSKLSELATVYSRAIMIVDEWYVPNYDNRLLHDVSWSLALCYDWLYDSMTVEHRDVARGLIAKMTAHRHSVGTFERPEENATNWRGFHDHHLLAALSIEGEEGYDKQVLEHAEETNAEFLTNYGVFASGMPHEGYAYYSFGMIWHSVADFLISRRPEHENFYKTTRFYKSIISGFHLFDPDGSGVRGHHDIVGDADGVGLIDKLMRHILLAKYMWPNDRVIDYMYEKMSVSTLAGKDNFFDMFHVLFGETVSYPGQTLAAAAGSTEPNLFCPDRGCAITRNEWKDDGFKFEFRCRQDKYTIGHVHSDVNSFELFNHGRRWIVDRGKFATTASDAVSTIMIDGVGACSAAKLAWPALSGKFVSYESDANGTIAVGDATQFYRYSLGAPPSPLRVLQEEHQLTWSDFYFPRAGETMPEWMAYTPYALTGYGTVLPLHEMQPVEYAYRSTYSSVGEQPFVLIVDDIKKDSQNHQYTWFANLVKGGQIEVESQTSDQMILKYKKDGVGGPRLLVKVLEAASNSYTLALDNRPVVIDGDSIDLTRIRIDCPNVQDPQFKVLLYPFLDGQLLPTTQWNRGKTELVVTTPYETRQLFFEKNFQQRTAMTLEEPAFGVTALTSVSSGEEGGPFTPSLHQLQITNYLSEGVSYTATSDQGWLELSSSSGLIGADSSQVISANIAASASSLSAGDYQAVVTIKDSSSNFERIVTVDLKVTPPTVPLIPAESFANASGFDLENRQLTFIPKGDTFLVYNDPATAFEVTPNPSSELTGFPTHETRDDGYWVLNPNWQNAPLVGGAPIETLYLGTNGLIHFDQGSSAYVEDITQFFAGRMLAPLWNDLNPAAGGSIYYEFLPGDRAVITFQNIQEYGLASSLNNFQVEFFDDGTGRIRITYLEVGVNEAIVGVSQGSGTPSAYPVEGIDFSAQPELPVEVKSIVNMTGVDVTAREWGSISDTATIRITLNKPQAVPLLVELAKAGVADSSDYSGSLSQNMINIPAGETSVELTLTAINDELPEGDEILVVSVVANQAYDLGDSTSVALTIKDSPYDQWKKDQGYDHLVLDSKDDDADQNPLLIEYALQANPNRSDETYTMSFEGSDFVIDLNSPVPADVNLSVQWCEDLSSWKDTGVTIEGQKITIPSAMDGERLFIRFQATRP